MPLLKLGLCGFFFWASFASAQVEVKDPQGILPGLRSFLNPLPWDQAVQGPQRATFLRTVLKCENKCSSTSCLSQCTRAPVADNRFDLTLEDATADSVSIYGTNNFAATLSRQDYETTGTWVTALLQGLSQFIEPVGSVEIAFGSPRMFLIIENGQARREFGYLISIQHQTLPGVMSMNYDIGFLSGRPLLESLVMFNDSSESFMKRKGVSYAN